MSTLEIELCQRCRCCEVSWEACDLCGGEGLDGHDCGEDTCCCLYPEDNETCHQCDGAGGWGICFGRCDSKGVHEVERPASRDTLPM